VNFQAVQFHFWVRAAIRPNADGATSQELAANVAGLLFGILQHPTGALGLARVGRTDDRVRLPPSRLQRVAGLYDVRELSPRGPEQLAAISS